MKFQVGSTLVLISSMMGLAACGGGAGGGNQFVSAPSDGGGTGGGGTGGTISNAGMYVAVAQQDQPVVTALHKFYNYDTPCSITPGASQDIECLLNIRELDLFSQGLKLEFNVPAGMCDYIGDLPYWYYNRPAGYGPTAVTVNVDDAASTSSCTYNANSGGAVAGVMAGHTCIFPGGSATVEGGVSCAYDYSTSGGPNCCSGTYTLTTNYKPPVGAATVTTLPNKSWGGTIGKCAGGPAYVSGSGWTTNSVSGMPYVQIRNGLSGTNKYYKIAAPISLKSADNTFAANFWDWTDYQGSTHPAATLPLPMKYSTDLLGNALPLNTRPNPAYTFTCLDTAYEVKHRIRLYINEWDESSQFINYLSPATRATSTPDAVPGSTCDITNDTCDDFPGWNWYQAFAPTAFPFHDFSTR
jgi:hypothetical protein